MLFKQKTAYEMRISDWISDVCSSDLQIGDLETLELVIERGIAATDGFELVEEIQHHLAQWQFIDDGYLFAQLLQLELDAPAIGRASCRERVCQYVYISLVAVTLKKK